MPKGISDGFMKPVQDAILEELKGQAVILCSDGEYRTPSKVIMEPVRDSDGQPLIPVEFLSGRFYLSLDYDLENEKSILSALGVREMTGDDLLSGMGEMYNKTEFLQKQSDSWHESVSKSLLDILEAYPQTKWQMRSLRIIPLNDDTWSTSWLPNLHFNPSSPDIPLDLGVYFIRPLDPHSNRYKLFHKLGITEADPKKIAERILEIHENADVDIDRPSLLAHVRYLFDHRHHLESVLTPDVKLWIRTNDNKLARTSEIYMDHPHYAPELSLSQFLTAPFIAAEYMALYPEDSKDFKVWCNWLQDRLGIHSSPRIPSLEFSSILQKLKTTKLLRVLKEYWPAVRDSIVHSPTAIAELRATSVVCTNGANEKLESTFLCTSKLSRHPDLPFLPVVDPDDHSWEFLEHLGVSLKHDGMAWLKRLIRLSQKPNAQVDEVQDMYKQLEARFDEDGNTKSIRYIYHLVSHDVDTDPWSVIVVKLSRLTNSYSRLLRKMRRRSGLP